MPCCCVSCVFVVKAGAISLSVYSVKKNPLVNDRGDDSVLIELREYTASLPNLIKFLTG